MTKTEISASDVWRYTPKARQVESWSVSMFWPTTPACNTHKWLRSCTVQFTVLVRQQKIPKKFTPPFLNGVLHFCPLLPVLVCHVARDRPCAHRQARQQQQQEHVRQHVANERQDRAAPVDTRLAPAGSRSGAANFAGCGAGGAACSGGGDRSAA